MGSHNQPLLSPPPPSPPKKKEEERKLEVRPMGFSAILEGSLVSFGRNSINKVVNNNYFVLH